LSSPPSVANNNGTQSVSLFIELRSLFTQALSRELDTEIIKNQNARDELYNLLDNTYYVDSNRYKIDHTTTDLEDSD
jgi:hypothetical protein